MYIGIYGSPMESMGYSQVLRTRLDLFTPLWRRVLGSVETVETGGFATGTHARRSNVFESGAEVVW